MNTWVLTKMEQNPFDARETAATAPEAFYMWSISLDGSKWSTTSGMRYAEVALLLQHFGVDKPADLAGKKFDSPHDDPSSALDLLLTQISHGGEYTPPTSADLLRRAAEAMAKMIQPDFSDVDDQTVYTAFRSVWDGFSAKEDWLASFKAEINSLSDGAVELVDANYEDFPMRVKGPASYLELVSNDRRQMVIIGPYSSPITFV